ncbi:hypothetical protein BLOT_014645 [Blomia tropicalis]|nr:hypothetical protein BLOT_014645 [Blomia tropicalis]
MALWSIQFVYSQNVHKVHMLNRVSVYIMTIVNSDKETSELFPSFYIMKQKNIVKKLANLVMKSYSIFLCILRSVVLKMLFYTLVELDEMKVGTLANKSKH